jgi:hypothetical protein
MMMDLQSLMSGDEISIIATMINLLFGLVLGVILKIHFEKFSSTLSGKRELARVLPFLVLIVCLIISIVKSSLALSLGLVGALSIVRFRTPIKEPEELIYLFMAIAIGLGLGANQAKLTILASLSILSAMSVLRWKFYSINAKALYLMVETSKVTNDASPGNITQAISKHVNKCDLKRMDSHDSGFQITYMIDVSSSEDAFNLVESVRGRFPGLNVTLIDQNRIPGV